MADLYEQLMNSGYKPEHDAGRKRASEEPRRAFVLPKTKLPSLEKFAKSVKAFWKKCGGYRPAADDTHLDVKGEFHTNPCFIHPALKAKFSPATLRAIADDLEKMADEIAGVGLMVDRTGVRELRDAAKGKAQVPAHLYDFVESLWTYPVLPAYPREVPEVLYVQVPNRGVGIVRNFDLHGMLYVQLQEGRFDDGEDSGWFTAKSRRGRGNELIRRLVENRVRFS